MPMYFPEARDIPTPTRQDMRACRTMLRGGSKSFFTASLLLPRHVHEPATALYAFCRQADDAIDLGGHKQRALAGLQTRLDRVYAGRPADHPADRAFAAIVAATNLPRMLPELLLEGFAWDAEFRTYETEGDLQDYAARVAGSVGAMMAVLMGARSPAALARACDLGIAMQLTNIARDVGEDAREGRLYLPLAWLRESGIDPEEFLRRPAFSENLAAVIRRLIAAANHLYARGAEGIALLPLPCRPGIHAAGRLYAAIGQQIARQGFDTVSHRAHVGTASKAALLGQSVAAALTRKTACDTAPLPCARAMVESCVLPLHPRAPRKPLSEQLLWVIDLFARLENESFGETAS